MDVNLIGKNSKLKVFGKEKGRLAIYLLIYDLLLLLSIVNINKFPIYLTKLRAHTEKSQRLFIMMPQPFIFPQTKKHHN